jgi:hypothetical protein
MAEAGFRPEAGWPAPRSNRLLAQPQQLEPATSWRPQDSARLLPPGWPPLEAGSHRQASGSGHIRVDLPVVSRLAAALTGRERVIQLFRALPPNSSSKPTPLRSGKRAAEKACHPFTSTARCGLTQVLGRIGTGNVLRGRPASEFYAPVAPPATRLFAPDGLPRRMVSP